MDTNLKKFFGLIQDFIQSNVSRRSILNIFFADVFLNILSIGIPIFLLQFVVQPYIANKIGANLYGNMLTVIGFTQMAVGIFGNSLNNARLVENHKYEKEKGDFSVLLLFFIFLNLVLVWGIFKLYQFHLSFRGKLLILGAMSFGIVSSYLEAEYRLLLVYKRIFLSKVVLSFGYVFGIFLFSFNNQWEWVFFIGSGLELIYVLLTTNFWKEPIRFTSQFKSTNLRVFWLMVSSSLRSFLNYFDRLFIFPIFGGAALAVYYAATIVGKTVNLITSPLSSVLISYSVRITRIRVHQYLVYCGILIFLCIVGGFACLFIGKPLISFLYPDYLEAAIVYLPITIGIAMAEVFYSFVWPIILRFGKSSSPMYITLIKAITYVSIAVRLSETHGIMGVCYAGLIGTLLQAGAVFIFGLLIIIEKNSNKK